MINDPGKPILTPGTADGYILTDTFSRLATLLAALLHRFGLVTLLGLEAVPVEVLHWRVLARVLARTEGVILRTVGTSSARLNAERDNPPAGITRTDGRLN